MSKGIRFGAPASSATRRAPARPPAGPDSTVPAATRIVLLDRRDPSVGLHDENRPSVPGPGQPLPEAGEIAGDERADVGVDHGRRGALVLLDSRQHFRREADVDARKLLDDRLPSHPFVPIVPVGVEIADRDGVDPSAAKSADRLRERRGVEGRLDAAVRTDPFADPEAEMPRHEWLLARKTKVVALGLESLAHLEDVAMTLRREQPDLRALAFDEGVGRHRHAMDDGVRASEELAKRDSERCRQPIEAVHDPGGLVGRRARRLRERHPSAFVDRDHIRERAADVHPYPVPGSRISHFGSNCLLSFDGAPSAHPNPHCEFASISKAVGSRLRCERPRPAPHRRSPPRCRPM